MFAKANPMQVLFDVINKGIKVFPLFMSFFIKVFPTIFKLFQTFLMHIYSIITSLSTFSLAITKNYGISLPLIFLLIESFKVLRIAFNLLKDETMLFSESLALLNENLSDAAIFIFFETITNPANLRNLLLITSAILGLFPATAILSLLVALSSSFTEQMIEWGKSSVFIKSVSLIYQDLKNIQYTFEDLTNDIINMNKLKIFNFDLLSKSYGKFISENEHGNKIFNNTIEIVENLISLFLGLSAYFLLVQDFPVIIALGFGGMVAKITSDFIDLKEMITGVWDAIGESGQKLFKSLGFEIINVIIAATISTVLPIYIGLFRVIVAFRKEIQSLISTIHELWNESLVFRSIVIVLGAAIAATILLQTIVFSISAAISAGIGTFLGAIATYHDEIMGFIESIQQFSPVFQTIFVVALVALAFFVMKFIFAMKRIVQAKVQASSLIKKNPILLAFGIDQRTLEKNIIKATTNANSIFEKRTRSCSGKGVSGCIEKGVKSGIKNSKIHTSNWITNLFGSPKTLSDHISTGISSGVNKGFSGIKTSGLNKSQIKEAGERARELRTAIRFNKMEIEKLERKMAKTINSTEEKRFATRIRKIKEENRIKSSALKEQQAYAKGDVRGGIAGGISSFIKGGKGYAKQDQLLGSKEELKRLDILKKRIDEFNFKIDELKNKKLEIEGIDKKTGLENIKLSESEYSTMKEMHTRMDIGTNKYYSVLTENIRNVGIAEEKNVKESLDNLEKIRKNIADNIDLQEKHIKSKKPDEKLNKEYVNELKANTNKFYELQREFQNESNKLVRSLPSDNAKVTKDVSNILNENVTSMNEHIQKNILNVQANQNDYFTNITSALSKAEGRAGYEKEIKKIGEQVAYFEAEAKEIETNTKRFESSRVTRVEQLNRLIQMNKNESEYLRTSLMNVVGKDLSVTQKAMMQKQQEILNNERKKLQSELSDINYDIKKRADTELKKFIDSRTREPGWFSKVIMRDKQMYSVDVIRQNQDKIQQMYEKSKKKTESAPLIERLKNAKTEFKGLGDVVNNVTKSYSKFRKGVLNVGTGLATLNISKVSGGFKDFGDSIKYASSPLSKFGFTLKGTKFEDFANKLSDVNKKITKSIGETKIFTIDTQNEMNKVDEFYNFNKKKASEEIKDRLDSYKKRI
ncbi:hypothetical protein KY334_07220, partial [Candidatus Woesearchaeota archaeon]|nr:hypothetical protein [Candidatus Woesearchaeota archaeon]